MTLGNQLRKLSKKSKKDRNKGSSNVVLTNSFKDYQQDRIRSLDLDRMATKIIISIGGEEQQGPSYSLPDEVKEHISDYVEEQYTNYTKAIGSMVHASTISREVAELVLVHGRLHAFMDFDPWADLKMSCFAEASSYVIFCPNSYDQFPMKEQGLGICPILFKHMNNDGRCIDCEHVLFVVHGPPGLRTGQVADSLFCDDGSFNEQFEFVFCLAFSCRSKEVADDTGSQQQAALAAPPSAAQSASVPAAGKESGQDPNVTTGASDTPLPRERMQKKG